MGFFQRKSPAELKREIKVLEKKSVAEDKQRRLSEQYKGLLSSYRQKKYATTYKVARKAKVVGGVIGHGIGIATGNAARNLNKQDFNPHFTKTFVSPNIKSPGTAGFTLKNTSPSGIHLRDAAPKFSFKKK